MKNLSIIVPVYNAENWLRRCVDSLLDQELPREDYEIILVDDGSKDGSPQICDDYSAAHPGTVRVIHQPNGGVSMARNQGIKVSHGEYLAFVDADDYVIQNCFSKILRKCKSEHLDMCFYKLSVEDTNGRYRVDNLDKWDYYKVYNGEDVLIKGFSVGTSCASFFSSKLIADNRLYFNLELSFSEDADFVAHCLVYANRVGFMDIVPYVYAYNGVSATNSPQKNAEKTLACLEMAKRLMLLAENENLSEKLRQYLKKWANSIAIGHLVGVIKCKDNRFACSYIKRAIDLGLYPIKGKTRSLKTTMLIPFINCRWLIKWMLR